MNLVQATDLTRQAAERRALGEDCSPQLAELLAWANVVTDHGDAEPIREFLRLCGGPGAASYGIGQAVFRSAGGGCEVQGRRRTLFAVDVSLLVNEELVVPQLQCRQELERLLEAKLNVQFGSIRFSEYPVRRAVVESFNAIQLRSLTSDLFRFADSEMLVQPRIQPGRENLIWLAVYTPETSAETEILHPGRFAHLIDWRNRLSVRVVNDLNKDAFGVEDAKAGCPRNVHSALMASRQLATKDDVFRDIDGISAKEIEFRYTSGRLLWTASNPPDGTVARGDAWLPDESANLILQIVRATQQRGGVIVNLTQ